MSELVKLVAAWEEYTSKHTTATAVEFCMDFLAKEQHNQLFGGITPPDLDTLFAKLIGRLGAMQTAYSKMALQELPGFELEWFYFLNTIYHLKEVNKSQVIQYNFTEQTTGIDTLNKLKKLGYITERTDPGDKRAKLVSLTKAGEKILAKAYPLLYKPTLLMYDAIDPKDKQVVVNILKNTEVEQQEIFTSGKNKSIDELLIAALGEQKLTRLKAEQQQRVNTYARTSHRK
ncbi:MarR family winged helix-turn-helix transcriptional regulator [Chitinophaga sp. Cy-1792]|uniref:MarR family winged helix-turn-helix transcriptional regulator n=1 Tax=Chitinophaga sp. Cy-1792 TaxID=2608339 RepID=UPI00141D7B78|nr:MarR family transcriptional regulator [Chitinophaga sp. Cy-1792]NIG55702.1 MarR family transcriptional regulator [Chitinophaga sp. Cy-1792]